jgi:uncharacterized protein (DUF58 family)
MRSALAGLTGRGVVVGVVGLLTLVAGWTAGQQDLMRIGVLLLTLLVLALALVARSRQRLSAHRRVDPMRVQTGQTAQVVLTLRNDSRLPTGTVLVADSCDPVLGPGIRFVLDRVEPGGVRSVRYPVTPPRRGRHLIGPLQVHLTDPFGLCRVTRQLPTLDILVATPVIEPLPTAPLGGEWAGSGDSRTRAIASSGEEDVTPRGYRTGDDLRRVHWKATARTGELMVRREEQPWESRAVLLLDTRFGAHSGSGSAATFEKAVSVAASLAVHLTAAGFTVDLVSTSDAAADLAAAGESDRVAAMLEALAVIAPDRSARFATAGAAAARLAGDGVVVAILGHLDLAAAEELTRLRHGRDAAIAVLIDPSGTHDDRVGIALAEAGWRLVPVALGDALAVVWPLAARTSLAARR